MNKQEIKDNSTDAVYFRGLSLYNNNHVFDFYVEEDEDNSSIEYVKAIVQGSGRNQYEVSLEIEDWQDIMNYTCDCPAYSGYPWMCKHCVAVALEYIDYEKYYHKENKKKQLEVLEQIDGVRKGVRRQTTYQLKELFLQKQKEKMLPVLKDRTFGRVRLEPILTINSQGISVEFRIGYEKMYVLKDVFSFEERIAEGKNYSYGKQLEFYHFLHAFSKESIPLVEFILKWVQKKRIDYNESTYYSYYYSYRSPQTRHISLSDQELEELLLLLDDREFLANVDYTGEKKYRIAEESEKFQLHIQGNEQGIRLSGLNLYGTPCINYFFRYDSPWIYKINLNIENVVKEFIYCLIDASGDMFVEKEDLKLFCNDFLPEIQKVMDCYFENFEPENYMVPKPEFKIYLDMPQKFFIILKPIAVYGEKEILLYDKKTEVEYRDFSSENLIKELLNQYSNAYDERERCMVISEDEDLIYALLSGGIEKMQQVAQVYVSDAIKRMQIENPPSTTVGISLSGEMLELKIEMDNLSTEELIDILSRYQRKKKYYRLKNGNLIRMEEEDTNQLMNIKDTLQLTDKELKKGTIKVPKFRAMYLDEQLKENHFIKAQESKDFLKLVKNIKTISESGFVVPKSLENILRNYQIEGFRWLKSLYKNGFGGILADDMGLGKTLQVITFILSEMQEAKNKNRRTLIVCPASLVFNWNSEFQKYAPKLSVQMVIGNAEDRAEMIKSSKKNDILITSYDLLRRDIEAYEEVEFFCQVIDEAQYIKNSATQAAKAVKLIYSGYRIALTGTPVENRLSELWSIFDYLMPGFLYQYGRFKEQIEQPILKENDEQAIERLQKMIRPFVLRRLKKDVLKDLPEKLEENRYVQMQGEQRQIYDAHVKRMKMMLEKTDNQEFRNNKIQILAELTKLRQLCCDPSILFEQYRGESAKTEMCIDLICSAVENGHKILLFSQFTSMLENLQEQLRKEKISCYTLTGSTPKIKRAQMVEAFNRDNTSVFCISLKAGGTGLNLTAADIVIHYDPWWNLAAQNQATDRAHRIGQQNVVTVYKLITKDTIEENIVNLQERKKELADKVLSGDGIASANFDREELMKLLQ